MLALVWRLLVKAWRFYKTRKSSWQWGARAMLGAALLWCMAFGARASFRSEWLWMKLGGARAAALDGAVSALTGFPPISNPWWNELDLWVDSSNVSTHASDSNDCKTVSTPCLTNLQVNYRLGGARQPQAHSQTRHEMSTNAGLATPDPIQWTPLGHDQVFYTIQGEPTNVATCTLAAATNRNTATGTLLTVTAACITAEAQRIVNATHPSVAWAHATSGGGVWTLTQALTPCTCGLCARSEVNTWAPGDSITVQTDPVLSVDYSGSYGGAGSGYLCWQHVDFGGTFTTMIGTLPFIVESRIDTILLAQTGYPEFENVYQKTGALSLSPPDGAEPLLPSADAAAWEGGFIAVGSTAENTQFSLGAILHGGAGTMISGTMLDVYLETSVNLVGPVNVVHSTSGGLIWGPGTLNELPGGFVSYTHGDAAAVFLNNPGSDVITLGYGGIGGQWCTTDTSTAVGATTNCRMHALPSNMDTAFGAGGFTSIAWWPGGFGWEGW